MRKLWQITDVVTNNNDCVVLKVKGGSEMDLISLGCFEGDETMFRVTKHGKHTFTVWRKDGTNYSWYWGIGGHTLVSDSMHDKRILLMNVVKMKGIELG
jgi:hypothetical protein